MNVVCIYGIKDFSLFTFLSLVPLPKSKDLSDPNNYRPISLLSIVSKPLEKHIHKHLLQYLDEFSLLHQFQSGYRPKHSCQTALLHMTNKWLTDINDSKMTGAVFLDLRKAFDLIDHEILVEKLSLYLKSSKSVNMLSSYLENRQQRVYVHGDFSTSGLLKSGVPQGSVLGPLLFCIFINDLHLDITSSEVTCEMFADDSTLHTAGKDVKEIETRLQKSLTEISAWCKSNSMLIHPQKTKSMLVSTRQKLQNTTDSLSLQLNSTPVEQVHEHRVLGIIIDDQFKWEAHTDNVCKKLSQNIFLLSKLKHFVNTDVLKLFFNAHIKSHVDFASPVWDMCPQTHLKNVNSLYRRSAKFIMPDQTLSTDDKMKDLNILPLEKQLEYNKCIMMYKVVSNMAPPYLCNIFEHSQTRYDNSRSDLKPIRPRIDLVKTSLAFSGVSLWNSLPLYLRERSSISSFKINLRKYFGEYT